MRQTPAFWEQYVAEPEADTFWEQLLKWKRQRTGNCLASDWSCIGKVAERAKLLVLIKLTVPVPSMSDLKLVS